jgi:hypothetical protein
VVVTPGLTMAESESSTSTPPGWSVRDVAPTVAHDSVTAVPAVVAGGSAVKLTISGPSSMRTST